MLRLLRLRSSDHLRGPRTEQQSTGFLASRHVVWAVQSVSAPSLPPVTHCTCRADNTARKQDKGANQQVGRWDVKRKEFESEISRNGWTPAAQARADAFLRECEGAPGKRWATCARMSPAVEHQVPAKDVNSGYVLKNIHWLHVSM